MALGLAFLAPIPFLVAQLTALAICYSVRRAAPVRATFNIANAAVTTVLAIAVTRFLAGDAASVHSARLWTAILVAVAVTAPIQSLNVSIVRSIAQRRLLLADAPRNALLTEFNAIGVASMGVLAAIVMTVVPAMAVVAAVPLVVILLVCRQVIHEHRLRTTVEFLYETAQAVHRTPDLEQALSELLDRTRTTFHAEYAAVLFHRDDVDEWWRVEVGATRGGRGNDPAPVWTPERAMTLHRTSARDGGRRLLDQLGAETALVAPLGTDGLLRGLFVVAERHDRVVGFSVSDRNLVERLAAQVAIGLENGHLERSLGALTRMEQNLRHQATHDALTGLANRTLFAEVLERSEGSASVLLIDLDDFKTINDSLGHAAGDEVLVGVAERLLRSVRDEDLVARLGGDEFAVVLPGRDGRAAAEVARRIESNLASPLTVLGRQVEIRSSIGVAVGDGSGDADELLRSADVAMYEAKHQGKGHFRMFEAGMDDVARARLQIITELRPAIEGDRFSLAYQSIVDLRTGERVAVEALLRWEHPVLGSLGPDRFIAAAEECGLIAPLGAWVIRHACAAVAPERAADGSPLLLHVNVSASHLACERFVAETTKALTESGMEPGRLVLELTEQAALADSRSLTANAAALRQLGVRLALDDFGTGYSSLAAVHDFPLDLIKIDGRFVRALGQGTDDSLVRAILAMATTLGLEPVAEGVEDERHRAALAELGCVYAQGYLFDRPGELTASEPGTAAAAVTP